MLSDFYDRFGWCQKRFARRADGMKCKIDSPEATCFCLSAAMEKEYPPSQLDDVYFKLETAIKKLFPGRNYGVIGFNDDSRTTLAEIRMVIEEAGV